jgi:NADPH:quinone reductase
MRALQFRALGDPAAQLALVNLPDTQLRRGWAVVRIRAASVNPSDVKNVEGQMEGTVLPRVPGRDFSGVVEAGPPDWIGADHARAASVGVTFVAGWLGLADYPALQQGEDVAMWPPMETSQQQSGCTRAGMARMSSSMR